MSQILSVKRNSRTDGDGALNYIEGIDVAFAVVEGRIEVL